MLGTWPLARRLRLALGAFAALLLIAVVALVVVLKQADDAVTRENARISPARIAASQLLTALVDQETGLRGFALSKDPAFLQPYDAGLVRERQLRDQLDAAISAGRSGAALTEVERAVEAWHTDYAELRLRDLRAGTAMVRIEQGKALFDRIRASTAVLDQQLTQELGSAQDDVQRARRLVVLVLLATALLVTTALVALERALGRNVLRPLLALGRQVQTVAHGTHDVAIEPSGPPDLQVMGRDVESMRQELVRALDEIAAAQQAMEERALELARSNADLEQFAYVASHDLQEPLRKVSSFCQLLEQRYGDQLDDRGHQYIAFAVDGALRMQRLINDLLTFSRVGRSGETFAAVDLGAVIARVWDAMEERVDQTGAHLDLDGEAPVVHGDPSLLQMLVANLVGNALKYRREDVAPHVRISSARDGDRVRVEVADNGIGIPEEYAEKVFVIFQRLHGRDEYEGTGIGLALCKKVVEYHGGTIELRPSPLGGTCVSFTLPPEECAPHA